MLEQQLLNALTLGSVYALFALGFTLVFGVLAVINLSHGALFMVGAYAALAMVTRLQAPLWLAMCSTDSRGRLRMECLASASPMQLSSIPLAALQTTSSLATASAEHDISHQPSLMGM